MIIDETGARRFVESVADKAAMERLEHFIEKLKAENRRQNLISRPSEEEIWQRHIADSAQLLNFVPRETFGHWLDLGTGAGFPGLVIAAILPETPVVLVESRSRRVEWLNRMCEELALKKCRVEGKRLELVEPFNASVISARAFAPLAKLLSLSAPFSTNETKYLLPKGRSAAQELEELPAKSRKLFHVEQSLTNTEAGIIVSS
jgi:16S rRNA (guanine527-N7)-methyltransferase